MADDIKTWQISPPLHHDEEKNVILYEATKWITQPIRAKTLTKIETEYVVDRFYLLPAVGGTKPSQNFRIIMGSNINACWLHDSGGRSIVTPSMPWNFVVQKKIVKHEEPIRNIANPTIISKIYQRYSGLHGEHGIGLPPQDMDLRIYTESAGILHMRALGIIADVEGVRMMAGNKFV